MIWKDKFNPGKRNSTTAKWLRWGTYDGSLEELHGAVAWYLEDTRRDIMIPVCALTTLVLSPAWEDIRAGWPEIDWDPDEENELYFTSPEGHAEQMREFMVWIAVQDRGRSWNPIRAENQVASLVRLSVQMTGGMHKGNKKKGDISLPNLDRIIMCILYWAIELHYYGKNH